VSDTPFASRLGLRPGRLADAPDPAAGAAVVRVDPADGAAGVFRDAPVVVRFSRPADPASVSSATVRVEDPEGEVPGFVHLVQDARVAIWRGQRLLMPGVLHFVVVTGVRSARGLPFAAHMSRFVSCALSWRDLDR
jgi:hypothetical protein